MGLSGPASLAPGRGFRIRRMRLLILHLTGVWFGIAVTLGAGYLLHDLGIGVIVGVAASIGYALVFNRFWAPAPKEPPV